MTRRTVLLVAALMFRAAVGAAHEGHDHIVMGTVTAIDARHLELKTPSGEVLSIAITSETTALREKKKVALREVQVGRRAVVNIGSGEDPLTAREIQIPAANTAAPAPSAH
jgi:hypothetical protein